MKYVDQVQRVPEAETLLEFTWTVLDADIINSGYPRHKGGVQLMRIPIEKAQMAFFESPQRCIGDIKLLARYKYINPDPQSGLRSATFRIPDRISNRNIVGNQCHRTLRFRPSIHQVDRASPGEAGGRHQAQPVANWNCAMESLDRRYRSTLLSFSCSSSSHSYYRINIRRTPVQLRLH